MIAQSVRVSRRIYNPVDDNFVDVISWNVLVTSDDYTKEFEKYHVDTRYDADKLTTKLNHNFHPEWFEH